MDIIKFIIEVTRRCTLNCEHCFRGEAENIDIEEDTIINSLKDVNSIKKLVITGGEPFLVHEKLEIIAAIINEYNIYVQDIYVVTNGTVLNDKVRNVLNKLSKVGNLHISVSFDSFHEIELERKNLKQIRDKNTKELIENYNAIEYGHTPNDIAGDYMLLIYPIGRAKNLTKERVKEIEDKYNKKFFISDIPRRNNGGSFSPEGKLSDVSIDINGNVVIYQSSFNEENEYSSVSNTNVNEIGLYDAVCNHIKNIGLEYEVETIEQYERKYGQRQK